VRYKKIKQTDGLIGKSERKFQLNGRPDGLKVNALRYEYITKMFQTLRNSTCDIQSEGFGDIKIRSLTDNGLIAV
jgi:hypothetical protein